MTLTERIDYIQSYLANPTRWLRFVPPIERRFMVVRAQSSRSQFRRSTMFSVILINIAAVLTELGGFVRPDRFVLGLVALEILVVLPLLGTLALAQRRPSLLIRIDRLFAIRCLGVTVGLIVVNRYCLVDSTAVFQAFSLDLLPVAFNILANIRFASAVTLSPVYGAALVLNSLVRPEFPADAKIYMCVMYASVTLTSLLTNYRIELAERKNFLNTMRDRLQVAEVKDANRELALLSRTDGLTGLANRREFDARFAAETGRARADHVPLTLIVLDIDHFKLYNDRLGHPQGDKCIRLVARAISESIGPAPAFAGRIGGEEFAAVLPGASIETAAATAQAIRSAVEAMQLPHPALGERRVVSVSIGVACLNPARPETPEALMARADAALYRAKRAGRDRAEVDLRVVGA